MCFFTSYSEEVIRMHYFVFGIGAGAILLIARNMYLRVQHWCQANRMRGAKECLDAVHDTLDSLAKSKPKPKTGH
jgi:hypothetical protein